MANKVSKNTKNPNERSNTLREKNTRTIKPSLLVRNNFSPILYKE